MRKKTVQILFVVLLLFCRYATSQNYFHNFQFKNIEEVTTKRAITSIIKDADEFIWIGTDGSGLFKYDGVNYKGYQFALDSESTINSDFIQTLFIDSDQNLWVGTIAGLSFYNKNLDTFTTIELGQTLGLDSSHLVTVNCLIEDNFGNILIGTNGFGLLKLNRKNLKTSLIAKELAQKNNFQTSSFIKSENGIIYIGSNYGLFCLDKKSQFKPVFKDKFKNYPIEYAIESLAMDARGFLWIGTSNSGLFKLKPDINNYRFDSFLISKNKILSLLKTKFNHIVCGTENDGLIILNENGEVIKKYLHSKYDHNGLKFNSIWSLFEDSDHRIWIGYYNKGIDVYFEPNSKFKSIEAIPYNDNSLQTSTVTSVVKDKFGRILMCSEGGGLDIYNPNDQTFIQVNKKKQDYYLGMNADDLQTIFIDSKHNIWLGSWNQGIYFLKNGTNKFINYNSVNTPELKSNRIFSFSEDSEGRIWIGTFGHGLHYYNPTLNKFNYCNSKAFSNYGLENSFIRKVLVDSDNMVWLATISGLFKIDLNTDHIDNIKPMRVSMSKASKNHNASNNILCVFESNDHKIWIGTDGAGLFCYDKKSQTVQNFNNYLDISEKSVRALISDIEDNLWISGSSGITKIDFKLKKCINFNTQDGLLSNEFCNNSVFKDNYGKLYFGNYEGLNYFKPNEVVEEKTPPTLYFKDFKLFNKTIGINDHDSPLSKVISQTQNITLNHNQSVFTIEYVGIEYEDNKKNLYAYYLEGFEKTWNYVGHNTSATYTNLAPGDYVFKVKSFNRNENKLTKTLSLKISISPPWWKTIFAYLAYFIIILFIVFFAIKQYKRRFESKQKIILEIEKAQQIEKLNNKKLQFFTNISHEFRTPLTLIINPLEDILKNQSDNLTSSVLKKLKTVHKSSDRLSRLINELMDFNKLKYNTISLQVYEIDIVFFVEDIVKYFEEELLNRNIETIFESSENSILDWVDPKMFEKIIFNLFSNALKFTPDGGTIKVCINNAINPLDFECLKLNNQLTFYSISVEDTGTGLDKKDLKKIFDRFYQVNNLNKAYYGSTGIGLEVVKEFVELHKGCIDVQSTVGVGTKFTVLLPLGKDIFKPEEISNDATIVNKKLDRTIYHHVADLVDDSEIDLDNFDTHKKNKEYSVLIVEDNSELRKYLKDELKKDYKVIVAENGKKGYDLAVEKLPDIIITDVIMPIMNGLDLCKNLKANIKTSHIPLLMLSAKAMVSDRIEGIDSGADIYLSKPFEIEVLKSSLMQLIKSRQIIFNNLYTGIINQDTENITTVDLDFIQKVLAIIHKNIQDPNLNVDFLASKVFLSRSQLYRKIKTLTGATANEFIRDVRLQKAKEFIKIGNDNINEISFKVGFSSSSYFTKCYKLKFGHLPTQEK